MNGAAFKPSDWGDSGLPIIRIQNLNDVSRPMKLTQRVVDGRLLVRSGDLLVSWSATLDAFLWKGRDAWLNQHIFRVIPNENVVNRDYLYFLLKNEIENLKKTEHLHGSTMMHINRGPFLAHLVPLPSIYIQRRVAAYIADLFTDLDDGEVLLARTRDDLRTWRRALLKAAVTGELTADWRAANPAVETGTDLLARILHERRVRWFAEPRNKGKRHVEPSAYDARDLPSLPDSWTWTTVDALLQNGIQNGLYLPKSAYNGDIPIMRIDDFQSASARPISMLRRVEADENTRRTYSLCEGDYVVNRVNSLSHLGKSFLVRKQHASSLFESNMMRMRPTDHIHGDFLEIYLTSEIGRARLCRNAKAAVNQSSINQTDVGDAPVPIPPYDEQMEIVAAVRGALDRDLTQQFYELNGACMSLRQSVLSAAFRGDLVA